MRVVLVSALLLATAGCAWQPPQASVPPPPGARVAAAPGPTPLIAEATPLPTFVVPARPEPVAPAPLYAAAPPPGIALAPTEPPPVVAVERVPAAPPPPPVVMPPVVAPRWASWFYGHAPTSPGRMVLSNFTVDLAEVEALITPYPDCAQRPGMVPVDMKLPLNGTFIVNTPAGSDVCWRSKSEAPFLGTSVRPAGPIGEWTPWHRVYTSFGKSVDAQL